MYSRNTTAENTPFTTLKSSMQPMTFVEGLLRWHTFKSSFDGPLSAVRMRHDNESNFISKVTYPNIRLSQNMSLKNYYTEKSFTMLNGNGSFQWETYPIRAC